jgi:3',5'-cyclic AMP phosphodiesterase CpdA
MTRTTRTVLLSAVLAAASLCTALSAAGPAEAGTPKPAPTRVLALGDVACDGCADAATAALFDPKRHAAVLMLGDLQYPNGSDAEFARSYDRTWGRYKLWTYPTPGNHEYHTKGAGGFFRYFPTPRRTTRRLSGHPELGYYSFDVGAWHVVALNSNCKAAGCGKNGRQLAWLAEDLRAKPRQCTLVMWHHPRFSSGAHGDASATRHFWDAAHRHGVDVVLAGHDHHYERFAPMDAQGRPDPSAPMSFVVGTGGTKLRNVGRLRANSAFMQDDLHGALELTLEPTSLAWRFLAVDGSMLDSGTARCR